MVSSHSRRWICCQTVRSGTPWQMAVGQHRPTRFAEASRSSRLPCTRILPPRRMQTESATARRRKVVAGENTVPRRSQIERDAVQVSWTIGWRPVGSSGSLNSVGARPHQPQFHQHAWKVASLFRGVELEQIHHFQAQVVVPSRKGNSDRSLRPRSSRGRCRDVPERADLREPVEIGCDIDPQDSDCSGRASSPIKCGSRCSCPRVETDQTEVSCLGD